MIAAIILSAGFGTRLRPLTDELPKPLVPVGDLPAVAHVERHLRRAGITRIVVNTHHRAEAFGESGLEETTQLVHEPEILGTAGGVAHARPQLGTGPVLVWNGDILADADVERLVSALASDLDAVWMIARRPAGQGTVGVGRNGEVVRVRAHRGAEEYVGGDFLGISVLSPRLVASLPAQGCLVGDVLGPLLARGGRIGTVVHEGPWDDLGSPAAYFAACQRWLRATGKDLYLGPGASAPAGTTGIIGAAAKLTGGPGAEVLLWPLAIARDLPPRTIVTTRGTRVTVP